MSDNSDSNQPLAEPIATKRNNKTRQIELLAAFFIFSAFAAYLYYTSNSKQLERAREAVSQIRTELVSKTSIDNKTVYYAFRTTLTDYEPALKLMAPIRVGQSSACSRVELHAISTLHKIETLLFRLDAIAAESSDGMLSAHQGPRYYSDVAADVAKHLGSGGCSHLADTDVIQSDIKDTQNDFDDTYALLSSRFYALTGNDLKITSAADLRRKLAQYRNNNWDRLSLSEKREFAGEDREVLNCINAALSGNEAARGIPSIVSEIAATCKAGLR